MKLGLRVALLVAVAFVAGCSKSNVSSPPPPTFTVGGTTSGLAGSGLTLRLNGGGNLVVAGSAFMFPVGLTSGSNYTVTVLTQPTNVSQTCTVVANGTGTIGAANVTNVAISCATNSFTVGGTVDVVAGAGLVLQNNGGNSLAIGTSGPFTFGASVFSGASYNVTVLTQPAGQTCVVTNATGTVGASNVTNVILKCSFSLTNLNDPLVLQQWHLKNTGQKAFADVGGVVGMDINVEPVFGLGITGSNVTVAVVDTGMEILHEDLAANVVPGGSWNFNTNTTDPTNTIDTTGDHGTSVAGLIAMALNNGKGGIGVAPHAQLKGFNFLSMNTPTEPAFLNSLGASGAKPNSSDVFVFNQSFGVSPLTPIAVDPMDESQYLSGVTSLRGGRGALYVKAAGNGFDVAGDPLNPDPTKSVDCTGTGLTCENANFDPDNTLPYQIVVGAISANGVKASYSTAGSAIWVSAPGGEFGFNASVIPGQPSNAYEPAMVTTDQSGCVKGLSRTGVNTSVFNNGGSPNTSCNYTNRMNGTSSATPVTVGVIALMLEAKPALTWRDVKHILASTARKIDATGGVVNITLTGGTYSAEPGWTANHASPTPFSYHNWYGFGLVDANAAVTMAKSFVAGQLGPLTKTGFVSSGALNLAIPNLSAVGMSSTIVVPATPVTVVEAVQIQVSVTHPAIGELGIELVSPLGTRSVLKNIADGYFTSQNLGNQVFLSNAFYGESPAGTWTIKVVDGFDINPGDAGTLTGWAIRVYGH